MKRERPDNYGREATQRAYEIEHLNKADDYEDDNWARFPRVIRESLSPGIEMMKFNRMNELQGQIEQFRILLRVRK